MNITRTVALATLLLAVATTASSAYDRRVRIYNDTSVQMDYFYASNTGSKSWEEDIFGSDGVLPAGNSVVIDIDDGSGYCLYDFKAVFHDGEEVISTDNNVCELSEFYFHE